jgi:toluene monooxygenase system protein B
VAPRPDKVVRVRRQGSDSFYPRQAKLCDTDIKPMEALEFIFCDS